MNTSALKVGMAKREAAWHERLIRHAASGLGVTTFCEYESVSTASFYRWRALLSGQTNAAAEVGRPAKFIDLGAMRTKDDAGTGPVSVSETGAIEVSLDLGHGLVLRIVRR